MKVTILVAVSAIVTLAVQSIKIVTKKTVSAIVDPELKVEDAINQSSHIITRHCISISSRLKMGEVGLLKEQDTNTMKKCFPAIRGKVMRYFLTYKMKFFWTCTFLELDFTKLSLSTLTITLIQWLVI